MAGTVLASASDAGQRDAAASQGLPTVGRRHAGEPAPVVLVHAGPPWQTNGGAVFLDAVAAHTNRPCIHLAISLDGRPLDVPGDFPRPVVQISARGVMRGMGVLRRYVPGLAAQLYWGMLYPRRLARRTAVAAASIRASQPHRVVYFLNSAEVPLVAATLNGRLNVPYVTMEWDLLDAEYDRLGLLPVVRRGLVRRLAQLRRQAAVRGVASEGMAAYYEGQWGLDTMVLRQPATVHRRALSRDAARTDAMASPFIVAICGNVYAGVEFRALLAGLDRLAWSVNGRTIEVRVIGELGSDIGPIPDRVAVSGWVPYEEALARLAAADVGYCPYWFEPERRQLTTTSFPSKLITYLSAGVPVFYHGPTDGTPAVFLRRYPAGVSCHSLDPAIIASTLAALLGDRTALAEAHRAASRAIADEFSEPTFARRVSSWLGDRPGAEIS